MISQTRVSQVMAGEPFPSGMLYQEVLVSPASALCARDSFKVGAAQSLPLGILLDPIRWKVAPALSRGMGPAFNSIMVRGAKQRCLKRLVGEL